MHSFLKPLLPGLCCLLLSGAAPAAEEPKKEKPKSGDVKKDGEKKDDKGKGEKAKGDKGKKGRDPNAPPDRISVPILPGHDSKEVKIPYYDTVGNLQMTFNIGTASRLDPDHLQMKDAQVETYNVEGESEMTIDLPVSVLDLNTRIVSSATKTTIKREDFLLVGDSVKFNTITRQGTLVGNVQMTIYNLNEEAQLPPPEPPADK